MLSAIADPSNSAMPAAADIAAVPPIWDRAGSAAALVRLSKAKEVLLDDASRAAHIDEIYSNSVRRGDWECDARKALKDEDDLKQRILGEDLVAALKQRKPEGEVLPLINGSAAKQKDEVRRPSPLHRRLCLRACVS